MKRNRGTHSPAFKAKVAQLASRFDVHPNLVTAWKKAPEGGRSCRMFDERRKQGESDKALVAPY